MAHDGRSGTRKQSLSFERAGRAVLMVDLVESVRLIEQDEAGAVSRWLDLVHHIDDGILPKCNGRLVKSLGDGLLLDFDTVRQASTAAFDIQRACTDQNKNKPGNQHFLLRMGIEISDVFDDERDIYGHGVNLAARLMKLAGPGEIVISANAQDQLVSSLDADIEDLGECYVKNVKNPIRAYRIGPAGPDPVIR
ncbi:Adenylate cyclase, partial [hydrothermal vent metagenome]